MKKLLIAAAIVALLCGLPVVAFTALFGSAGAALLCNPTGVTDTVTDPQTGQGLPAYADLTPDQRDNARTIIAAGNTQGVARRGWVIAIATALQESHLVNLGDLGDRNDHDSLGLFQQRPSQGWGTPAQILDPAYAATTFYEHLVTVPGWQTIPLTEAAQAVQRSAYPDAYAKWEPLAGDIVDELGAGLPPPSATGQTPGEGGSVGPCDGGIDMTAIPAGYVFPPGTPLSIMTVIGWAFDQLGTAYQFGGSCTDAHSTNMALHCDCSSLVQQAYLSIGVQLPRVTGAQVHAGVAVPDLASLFPGDLLFIPGSDGTAAAPAHVGMFIGNGQVIEAPHTGDVVRVVPLSAGWKTDLTIRRPDPQAWL